MMLFLLLLEQQEFWNLTVTENWLNEKDILTSLILTFFSSLTLGLVFC